MILPHGLLKTWGEPCGARLERLCGVMTALPKATSNSPLSPGMRGKYGEFETNNIDNGITALEQHQFVFDLSYFRRGYFP